MGQYRIVSSAGVDMGVYQGGTEADAYEAMCRDAGYESSLDAAGQAGGGIDEMTIVLVPVPSYCTQNDGDMVTLY